eukprot:COSAG02_NODE_27347_length_611_cov_4.736620_1_plen_79_part_00
MYMYMYSRVSRDLRARVSLRRDCMMLFDLLCNTQYILIRYEQRGLLRVAHGAAGPVTYNGLAGSGRSLVAVETRPQPA